MEPRLRHFSHVWRLLCALLSLAVACAGQVERAPQSDKERSLLTPPSDERAASCPQEAKAPQPLPGVAPELETLGYWLERWRDQLDEPLLTPEALRVHDRALRTRHDGEGRIVDLTRAPSVDEIVHTVMRRFAALRERFTSGEYVSQEKSALALLAPPTSRDFVEKRELVVALTPVRLYCAPFFAPIHSTRGTKSFDRNSCSEARAQEPIEILGTLRGQTLARSRYAIGFLADRSALSPPVPPELTELYRAGSEVELTAPWGELPEGTLLPAADAGRAWIASAKGFARSDDLGDRARPTARALTRRALLTKAFSYLGSPYGWGDERGGRDCSRFVLDVLASFGLHLPRHSAEQSRAGVYSVDVPAQASETERLALLDTAAQRGVVLAHFPGHIMLYLGRDKASVPRALHSFAEYLAPCEGGGETLFEVGRVTVSDLSLGKGTSRRSFLERITTLTVFGKPPGHELLALSRFRPPLPPELPPNAACEDSLDVALFRSPREPHAGAPLRVIGVTTEDLRPASLWLLDGNGKPVSGVVHELGVGPYARWLEVKAPRPGRYTAVIADGERVFACERIRVASKAVPATSERAPESPVWQARWAWERDTEHLFAAFIEQLFSHSLEDLRSWSSLSELLKNPERNLLYNHLGLDEDTRLDLKPDCADLPYFLRAYFAWKVSLPFGFRPCSRGREGVPPRCGELKTQALPIEATDDVDAFQRFLRRELGAGVHSASGRTLPTDEASDFYPLPLTREALKPGTMFADPYGHVIMVAKWVPQGILGEGMLLGADAQPDATVGRRRFFRGNFLFTPDVRDVGAGFKAFRPIVRDASTGAFVALDDKSLAQHPGYPAASLEQYQGSRDDFYAHMDALIYPRAIAMHDKLRQLVSAFEEQVVRRVEAIDVGEAYMRTQRAPIAMPEGYAIFETSGAWEDFATPSRDMRLLFALDTVRAFPNVVAHAPERFGLEGVPTEELEKRVAQALDEELKTRRFRYTRSDGSTFELTLRDVVDRAEALEVGYNPNDCVEVRWGAPDGSDERATCTRAAPKAQRALMERYRSWFATRTRPPRP